MKIRQLVLTSVISFAVMGAGATAFAGDPEPMQQQQQMQQTPPPPPPQQQQMPPPQMQHQQMQQASPAQHHKHDRFEQRRDRDDRHHVRFVRVHRGDTLNRIARKYHTSVYRLKRLNHLRGDTIYVGQRLRVR